MCSIASPSESTTPTAIFSPWYSVSQSTPVASPTADRSGRLPSPRIADQLHPGVAQLREQARQQIGGDFPVDQQRLRRVADPRPLDLRVVGDPLRHLEIRILVHVDVAIPRRRVHHRNLGDPLQRLLQPLATSRDDQIDQALLRRQLLAAARGHHRREARRTPPAARPRLSASAIRPAEERVGALGAARTPQDRRVPTLQTERRGVDRHVRARLVDDRRPRRSGPAS